jgi:hypothetical protein
VGAIAVISACQRNSLRISRYRNSKAIFVLIQPSVIWIALNSSLCGYNKLGYEALVTSAEFIGVGKAQTERTVKSNTLKTFPGNVC